ncbi:MAG TPA: glycosyltransferase family 39 protein [Humisphaera sp.]
MTDPRRFTRPTIVLLVACLVAYVVGNAEVPLWDRDEPRYAQCAKQMLETGDWVLPRYLDDLRLAKPPLIYWLQATSMSVLGPTSAAVRLPSVVGMLATLLLVALAVRKELSAEHAFWTVVVLGSSAMSVLAAKVCLTDAVLLFFITVAQLCLYRIWTGRATWLTCVCFGLAIGLTLMTKGPVGLGVHLMTLVGWLFLTWSLRWRRKKDERLADGEAQPAGSTLAYERKPVVVESPSSRLSAAGVLGRVAVVIAGVLVVSLPWAFAVEARWRGLPQADREQVIRRLEGRRGGDLSDIPAKASRGYVQTVINYEVLERSKTGQEGHKGPPGYYAVAIWGIFMPWSLILPAVLVTAWVFRRETHIRFALGAVIGPWVMFEVIATKLPHYLLPCFVPLAVLSAETIVRSARGATQALTGLGFRRSAVAWGIIMALVGSAPWLLARVFWPQPWLPLTLLSVAGVVYAGAVVWLVSFKGRLLDGMAVTGFGGLLIYMLMFRGYLPECPFLQTSPRVAAVLKDRGGTKPGDVVMLDYKEPSLSFYQGGTIRENSNLVLTRQLLADVKATWWVVTRDVWDSPKTEPEARAAFEVVEEVTGLDAADELRKVTVMVLKRKTATVP